MHFGLTILPIVSIASSVVQAVPTPQINYEVTAKNLTANFSSHGHFDVSEKGFKDLTNILANEFGFITNPAAIKTAYEKNTTKINDALKKVNASLLDPACERASLTLGISGILIGIISAIPGLGWALPIAIGLGYASRSLSENEKCYAPAPSTPKPAPTPAPSPTPKPKEEPKPSPTSSADYLYNPCAGAAPYACWTRRSTKTEPEKTKDPGYTEYGAYFSVRRN